MQTWGRTPTLHISSLVAPTLANHHFCVVGVSCFICVIKAAPLITATLYLCCLSCLLARHFACCCRRPWWEVSRKAASLRWLLFCVRTRWSSSCYYCRCSPLKSFPAPCVEWLSNLCNFLALACSCNFCFRTCFCALKMMFCLLFFPPQQWCVTSARHWTETWPTLVQFVMQILFVI